MSADLKIPARSGLGLLEEATQLLREAPAAVFICYYLGTIPFLLYGLFFFADMSRSADAAGRLTSGSVILALLYFWMRGWQTIFCERLLALVEGHPPGRLGVAGFLNRLLPQMAWQALALFLLPIALMVLIPFGWVFAFHQNLSILCGRPDEYPHPWKTSVVQATRWPSQNHSLLLLGALVYLFALLNLATAVFTLPGLLNMLWGTDLIATRHALSLLNTTVIAGVLAVTYAICDPLIRAAYVLRCFYGVAQRSGADLRSALRRAIGRTTVAATCLLLALAPFAGAAGEGPPVEPVQPVSPVTVPIEPLDDALERTIAQREYSWRMPRDSQPADETSLGFWDSLSKQMQQWLTEVGNFLEKGVKGAVQAISKVVNWIFSKFPGKTPTINPGPWGLPAPPGWAVLGVLVALVVGVLCWLYFKKLGRPAPAPLQAQPLASVPDLTDENVTADQLSEDNWLKLAGKLAEQGDYRLSLRALYLASLAHLSRREIIQITRSKSNHDYWREVQRRGRAWEGLPEAFQENLSTFERIWYGMHEVNQEIHGHFQQNLQRIQAC